VGEGGILIDSGQSEGLDAMEKRKNGSILIALLGGGLLLIWGIGTIASFDQTKLPTGELLTNGISCILFSVVLLWWVFSPEDHNTLAWKFPWPFYPNRNWGIGFPTITMVVTVYSAIVIIFTLTHDFFSKVPSR
jgi:hypothetical protein